MHDLSCETQFSRYTLRCVLRDPITAGSLILTGVGTAVSAMGTLAAGDAAQKGAEFKAASEEPAAQEARAA